MNRRFLIAIFLLLAVSNGNAAERLSVASLAQRWVGDVYQPSFAQFAHSARQWVAATDDLCGSARGARIYDLQTGFADLASEYSRIEIFRSDHLFGSEQWSRLFYWPDTRRVGERQLRRLLEAPDIGALTVDQLSEKSVALQGFPALERLLFNADVQQAETMPRCHVIKTIIGNIAVIAEQLRRAWRTDEQYVQDFLHPHEPSPYFRNDNEVLRKVMTEVVTGLDTLIDRRLIPMLSGDPQTLRSAPLWRSQRTLAMISGNVSGIRALLFDAGLLDQLEMRDELAVEFDYVNHSLDRLKYRFELADVDGRLEQEVALVLTSVTAVLDGIRFTVLRRVMAPIGIGVGFNAEDGD